MLREPDLITIETIHDAEVAADHAFVHLRIEGTAAFSSRAVAKQSREVADFLERMTSVGIPAEAAEVTGVRTTVVKDGLRRSSTAHYQLRIKTHDLKRLPSLIGLLPDVKQVELQGIEWGYDSLRDQRLEWLRSCLDESRKKAALVADGLEQSLIGVHRFSEKLEEVLEHRGWDTFDLTSRMKSVESLASPPPYVELSHTRRVTLRVTVSYLVSPRTPS